MNKIKKLKAERRIRQIVISEDFLLSCFKGAMRIDQSYPADSIILSVHYEPRCGGFLVTVMHPSFEPVPEGQWPVDIPATISHLNHRSMKKVDKVFYEELSRNNDV